MTTPVFTGLKYSETPFPHARIPCLLPAGDAGAMLAWLEARAPWKLRIEHFYEQYEFSLLTSDLSDEVKSLVQSSFIETLREEIRRVFRLPADLDLIDVNAHRLTGGQTIRVHNDFIEGEETHRLLVQLNSGWTLENGGLLMLFNSGEPEDVSSLILPKHGSAFAFEISPRSFHAVSQIKDGERYTIVYSFRTRH